MRQRPIRVAMGTCALGALLVAAAPARAQQCVSAEVEREITSCEGLQRRTAAPTSAPSALGEAGPPPVADATSPEPGVELAPPDLGTPSQRREERRLVGREREILERLRDRTPEGSPQRRRVLERLEQTCAEQIRQAESRAGALEQVVFEARQDNDAAQVRQLVRTQREARRTGHDARQCAIRSLAELVRDYRDAPGLDRSLFALAYHLERIRQQARARQVYHRLIRDFPESRYVPQAYLAFAEHYFAEGELDPARQFYERVLTIEAEHNPVYGYARYKLAWVRYNLEDFQGALRDFVAVLEHTREYPDRTQSTALARQVRRELVLPYSHVGRPDRALIFFRRVAADDDEAYTMLEALAGLYHDTGSWPNSVRVHHQLMAERPQADGVCGWQARVLDATIASRPKADQVTEVRRLADVRRAFASAEHPAPATRRCNEDTATSIVLLATAWHREAVGTDSEPGTRDPRTMDHAAALYELVLDLPRLESLRLPRIDQRDRPTTAQMAFFRAELLYERDRHEDAARAYEAVLALEPEATLASEVAYRLALTYDRMLGDRQPPETPDDRRLTARELTELEQRMALAFQRFSCVAPDDEDAPNVLYRWARVYYEANQFERAGALFARVVNEHPQAEVATYAAVLQLDSLSVLADRRGRAECLEALAAALEPIETRYCNDPGSIAENSELCHDIVERACGIGERRARSFADARQHVRSARLLVDTARARLCEHRPRMLYNAAIQFEAARLLGRTIRVRRALIQSFPGTPLARRAIFLVGANYHALAIYGQAADYYERYASEGGRCDPSASAEPCPNPAEGLRNAVTFRLGLGETERALEDARTFERLYRRTEPRLTAEVVFAIGAIHQHAEAWPRLVEHYRGFVRRYAAHATPTQLARAHMAQARGWIAQGQRDRATRSLQSVVQIHERGAEEALGQLGLEDDALRVATAQLRDAVAEARFELAEVERVRFEALRFPTLRGTASLPRVSRWAERDFRTWMEQKLALIVAAEGAYAAVAPLNVPRWRIAAAARLGEMYDSLVRQVRGSPIPAAIERDPELYDIYTRALDEATEPYLAVAMTRYESCLTTATQVRWFDEHSQGCERALHRLDAARFPMAAELRGQPGYRPLEPARPGPTSLQREDSVMEEPDGAG